MVYDSELHKGNQNSEVFTLYTSDLYNEVEVKAEIESQKLTLLNDQFWEVETEKVCIHPEDNFPLAVSVAILCTGMITQWGNINHWHWTSAVQ